MKITKNEALKWIKDKTDLKLYNHSIGTQEMAVKLAGIYNVDEQKAMMAGILHDCAKRLSHNELISYARFFNIEIDEIRVAQPGLLHAPVGAKLVETELKITDDDILHAIAIHNTGSLGMSELDKVLFLADTTENNRNYPGVEAIREISLAGDINKALLVTIDMKIRHILDKDYLLHPMSVEARNDVLRRIYYWN